MEITPEMRRIAAAVTAGRVAPDDDATARLIKNAAFACDGATPLTLVGAAHAKQAELDTLQVAIALYPILAKAAEPAPTTKIVRVELAALTRLCYSAYVRVPADATAAQLEDLVDRLYDEVDGGDYHDDSEFWEKASCYAEAVDSEEVADFVATLDEDGAVDELAEIPVEGRIRARLAILAAATPATMPTWIKLYTKSGASRWLAGDHTLAFVSMFSDRAFTFADRAQAERVVAEFPTYFTDGSYEIVAATLQKG